MEFQLVLKGKICKGSQEAEESAGCRGHKAGPPGEEWTGWVWSVGSRPANLNELRLKWRDFFAHMFLALAPRSLASDEEPFTLKEKEKQQCPLSSRSKVE